MKMIYDLKINRNENIIGISPEDIMFSFKSKRGNEYSLSLLNKGKKVAEFTSSDGICVRPEYKFDYGEKYTITVTNESGDSESLDFETAIAQTGEWICADENVKSAVFRKTFSFDGSDGSDARIKIAGLGLYRAFLNGHRIGNDWLTPMMNDYDDCVRAKTYELTLQNGENVLEIFVGNGWYKGQFGIDGGFTDKWGKQLAVNAVIYTDSDILLSTDSSWYFSAGKILDNGIYYGEDRNDTREYDFKSAKKAEKNFRIVPDYSAPIRTVDELKGRMIITPKNEKVIDFGQNGAGIVRFNNHFPKGTKIVIRYSEVLQDGCFYRDNLRTARAEYTYISDGESAVIEPYFTYYGFRYAMVECDAEWSVSDFTAVYFSTYLSKTAELKTNCDLLNKLINNVTWGRYSNFIDVPTDCPQRDERLGWTADTQVFVPTACYQSEAYVFYKKFMRDMAYDQKTYYGGDFPMYSPSNKGLAGHGGAVWADAGVIVPWLIYENYGDKELLMVHYSGIKEYVDLLISGDDARGDNRLPTQPFTFGDWLAQDGICAQSMKGGTDDTFIRAAYYYNALEIAEKSANVLGLANDEKRYSKIKNEVKSAIQKEYFTATGRLALDTQAAYIIALKFDLGTDRNKTVEGFRDRLRRDLYKIKCGFVGAPLMIRTMFDCGLTEEALRILFNKEYPGWFYEILLGATTVWERWNSLLPDGKISGTMMNSLNHYAYGSVAEAVYAYIGGLSAAGTAWQKAEIHPIPSRFVTESSMKFDSPIGEYRCDWFVKGNNFNISVTIPHGGKAKIILPHSGKDEFELTEGEYSYSYPMNIDFEHPFDADSLVYDIVKNEKAAKVFSDTLPQAFTMANGENEEFLTSTVRGMSYLDMFGISKEALLRFEDEIRKISI